MMEFDNLLPGVPLVESPLFTQLLDSMDLSPAERVAAIQLNERGYAVIDFPDPDIDARIERMKNNLADNFSVDMRDETVVKNNGDHRVQDAWKFNADVKAIACNSQIMSLLSKLYGRTAFPFQTLNFPVGTQQHAHSDSVHFSSLPERFMCGVWLAMEDIHADAGPLLYHPGSHKWPIVTNALIGRRGWKNRTYSAQAPYERVWRSMIAASNIPEETFLARKGQALIWAANLLHGGSQQNDPTKTRWSQVTHYYFKDCIYYTPAFSDEPLGLLDTRTVVNIATGTVVPSCFLGEVLAEASQPKASMTKRMLRRLSAKTSSRSSLPVDFDAAKYLELNPDVETKGEDAGQHYLKHGREEGRRYRID